MLKKLTFSLILLASVAVAQTPVAPLPNPKIQFLSATGVPLAGGKMCTFQSGTTTPLTTYSESTGTSANTNPITLDSGGFASIWVTSSAIKFIVYSSTGADGNCPNAGTQQYSVDGIAPNKLISAVVTNPSATQTITGSQLLAITGTFSVSGQATVGSLSTAGQITSTLASGTAPLAVSSTTPVANLTTVPTTYNAAGTQRTGVHLVTGQCTLGTDCVITLAGSAVFTAAGNYFCGVVDVTAANAVFLQRIDGSHFTITGTGTDTITYSCVGN